MKKCEQCLEEYKYKKISQRFCSRVCFVAHRTHPKKQCRQCNAELSNKASTYCSVACQKQGVYAQYIEKWLSGEESGGHKYGTTSQVRRWIRERYGLFCWNCGWNKPHPLTGEPPLQIDHIDGDASNNRPDNLRLLCGGCHSLTPTYGNWGGRTSSRTYRYDKEEK